MILRYTRADGTPVELIVGDQPVSIGRSPQADFVVDDERASRLHCGLRFTDGEYYLKDLESKNGTYLNNERIDLVKINPGDKIRVGSTVIAFEHESSKGTTTTFHEVEEEMSHGKGYNTILKEIVNEAAPAKRKKTPGQTKT